MKLDEQKYTIPIDRVDFVNAKNAAKVLNEVRICHFYSSKILEFILVHIIHIVVLIVKIKNKYCSCVLCVIV